MNSDEGVVARSIAVLKAAFRANISSDDARPAALKSQHSHEEYFQPGRASSFMATNAQKIWYRTKYLKSEHWQNLRLSKLASVKGQCRICSRLAWNHDVHHLNYRSLFDVKLDDLVALCRKCHKLVHFVTNEDPSLKARSLKSKQWLETVRLVKAELKIQKTKTFFEVKASLKAIKLKLRSSGLLDPLCKWKVPKQYVWEVINGESKADEETMMKRVRPDYKFFKIHGKDYRNSLQTVL